MKNLLLQIEKTKIYYVLIFIIGILLCSACHTEMDKNQNLVSHQDGVVPTSINQVMDVFELKYGDVYEGTYDGQAFRLSITNVADNIIIINETEYIYPFDANKIRMHAFLNIKTGGNVYQLEINSRIWGPYEFNNDGSDVQQVWNLLSSQDNEIDSQSFVSNFDKGTLIANTSFSIFMAKAYPFACKLDYEPQKSMYKFIFIITNQKTQ